MSKLKEKLSKWFLNTAKKLDEKTVNREMCLPMMSSSLPSMICYDQYHIDKVHAQYMISNTMMDTYGRMKGYEGFIEERIPEILTRGLAEEIMKVHKDEIKKTQLASMDGTIYELDVYMCKPQKKETSF